jgi:hypothetical protein
MRAGTLKLPTGRCPILGSAVHSSELYCAALNWTTLILLRDTVAYCTALHCTSLCCTVTLRSVLFRPELYCRALSYTVSH